MAGRRAVGRGILVAGMVAAMAACGGGSGDGSTDDVGEDVDEDAGEAAGALVGTLVVIDPEVTLDGSAVDGSADVGAGSAIETDGAGFAELGLALGSLLRIDVGTSVEVLELSDDGGAVKVRTRVESGRTWSRTGDLGDDDSYVVETPVAVAETTDGAFVTECNDIRCSFTVLKGSLDVELPDGTAVTVDAPARSRRATARSANR